MDEYIHQRNPDLMEVDVSITETIHPVLTPADKVQTQTTSSGLSKPSVQPLCSIVLSPLRESCLPSTTVVPGDSPAHTTDPRETSSILPDVSPTVQSPGSPNVPAQEKTSIALRVPTQVKMPFELKSDGRRKISKTLRLPMQICLFALLLSSPISTRITRGSWSGKPINLRRLKFWLRLNCRNF